MSRQRFIAAALGVGVLYLTVWPHEVGHALVAYLYGCKANWWQTDTSWLLWSSWGGKIDYACLRARSGAALGLTNFGGIAVNLLQLGLAPVVGRWWRLPETHGRSRWPWMFLATLLWALANYAEAFSYLVANTAWLKSDMRTVVVESGISRGWWLLGGVGLAVLVARLLRQPVLRAAEILAGPGGSHRAWRRLLIFYTAAVGCVMVAARIFLT